MTRERLVAFARDWIAPAVAGLAGAAVLITGAELGGAIGWSLIGLAAGALVGMVAWAVRPFYTDDPFDWPDDELPPDE